MSVYDRTNFPHSFKINHCLIENLEKSQDTAEYVKIGIFVYQLTSYFRGRKKFLKLHIKLRKPRINRPLIVRENHQSELRLY